MSNLADYYFIKELLDRETALAYNGQTGYYNVNATYFSSNFVIPDSEYAYTFYNAMRAVFRSNYDYSNDAGFINHESLVFFTFSGDDNLYYCFHNTPQPRGNLSKNEYYEVQFRPADAYRNIYKYDVTTKEISIYSNMSGNVYKSVPVYKILVSTGNINVWSSNDQYNYLPIDGLAGNSAGGWQVPNPNPSYKIMINGHELNDIKLNGKTPNKIMLNGICYFENQQPVSPTLYNWDLTSSTVDPVSGTELQYYTDDNSDNTANVATKAGLYTASTGVTFSDQQDISGIVIPVNLYKPGYTLEIDFTNFTVINTYMDWGQFFVETHKCMDEYNYDYEIGLYWGLGGDSRCWYITSNYRVIESGDTSYGYTELTNYIDAQLFANSTLKIKTIESANGYTQWEIYKNDILISTTDETNYSGYPLMPPNTIDSENQFMLAPFQLNATVTGIRIYQE